MDLAGFNTMIKSKWDSINDNREVGDVWSKLRDLKVDIKGWAKDNSNFEARDICALEAEIQHLDFTAYTHNCWDSTRTEIMRKRANLWALYRAEERMWRQKSRERWIKEGDRNTSYFHLMANIRRKQNSISQLSFGNESVNDPSLLKNLIANHFQVHFSKNEAVPISDIGIPFPKLSADSVALLEGLFTADEVKAVIFNCDGGKAPGPDGYNMDFFKKNWSLLQPDVMNMMHSFYRTGSFDKRINKPFLTLIPKRDNPTAVNDFRPISLVGILYKIISKVLAGRLQGVMGELIGPNQFAFAKGRQILDSSLVANEVIEMVNSRKEECLLFKVDFEKAFDSISWQYLDVVLEKMGFGTKWRGWISECVTTVSLSVLVNGSATREFPMKRGLRQGCALSPFLFNLVAESLSLVFNKATSIGLFAGVRIREGGLMISHLQFSDDTIIFCDNSETQILNVRRVLRCFQVASGLKINFKKNKLFEIGVDYLSVQALAQTISCCADRLVQEGMQLLSGVL